MATYAVTLTRSVPLRLRDHPDSPTTRDFPDWCAKQVAAGRPLAVDLFAGAGGLSLGLHEAGWAVAAAVDHDPEASSTHRANIPGLALDLDLSNPDERRHLTELFAGIQVDLVAGGPPCQPFSRAGRSKIRSLVDAGVRDEVDPRKELWRAYLAVVLELKPRAVLMENVPDMALGDDLVVVRQIVQQLEEAGYATEARIVDAWRYGVPQHRKRLILLARNDGGSLEWPAPDERLTTIRDSLSDLPSLNGGTGDRELAYVPSATLTDFQKRMRANAEPTVIHDHMTRPIRLDDLEIFRMMDSKTLYSDIPAELRRYTADSFDDKYKRLDWDDVSRTITAHIAKDGYWYIHPAEHRTLTVREAARLQTFPDRFRFSGTRSDAFRQIGNAVPPALAAVAARILAPKPTRKAAPRTDSTYWLKVREALDTWAKQQSQGALWHMFPSVQVTPAVAIAAAVLSSNRADEKRIGRALSHIKGRAKLLKHEVDLVEQNLSGQAAHAIRRVGNLGRKKEAWHDPDKLATAVGLSDSERDIYTMLLGGDVMLRGQAPLRVAARVLGSGSDTQNRLTDGRMDMARLVGSGEGAPRRMAALRALASGPCGPRTSACAECPLAQWCHTARLEGAGAATS